jgi:hypothetical protein
MHAGAIEEVLRREERGFGGLDEYDEYGSGSGEVEKCTRRAWMSLVGDESHSPSWFWWTMLSRTAASEVGLLPTAGTGVAHAVSLRHPFHGTYQDGALCLR